MNHTYNSEACPILKILLEADAVWNFSRHTLHQATAIPNSKNVPVIWFEYLNSMKQSPS
jgi:hypothetical protein